MVVGLTLSRLGKRYVGTIAAIACALILITAASLALTRTAPPPAPPAIKPVAAFGPKLLVHEPGGRSALANNTTINIQIFSAVPNAFRSTGLLFYPVSPQDQWTNGVNEELLNATLFPGNNTTAFFLAPSFNTIAQEWTVLLSHDQGRNFPSLTVEAVKTVNMSGNLYLYQYYNNLPYNPFDLKVVNLNQTDLALGGASWFDGTGVNVTDYSQIIMANLELNLTLEFPSHPIQVVPVPPPNSFRSAHQIPAERGPAGCAVQGESCIYEYYYTYPSVTTNTLVKTTFANGTLPLLGVHIGRNAEGGGSVIALSADVNVLNDTIELNSVQPYENASGQITTTMSTSPSFAHEANVSVGQANNQFDAIPTGISKDLGNNNSVSLNRTTAIVGIQGVEYEFQHYKRETYNYVDYWERMCCPRPNGDWGCFTYLLSQTVSTVYDGQYTDGEIVHVNSTAGLALQAGFISIWAAWVIQHTLANASNGSVTLTTSGTGSSYEASTIWADTNGYLDASNAYSQAANLLGTFSTALGLGLAIIDASAALNGADFDATEPTVVADSLSLIADTIGMAASVLNAFSSISAYTGTQSITLGYGFSNVPEAGSGSPYTMAFFESQSPVSLSVNGNTYSFFAPEDFLNATAIA